MDLIQVEGGRQLRKSMRQAGIDMGQMKAAHADAARIVQQVAQTTAPRRSGTLASSVRSSGTTTAAIVRAGYKSVPYAGAIHFGWPAHHIRAQPWITNAAKSTQPRWQLAYKAAVNRILRNIRGA